MSHPEMALLVRFKSPLGLEEINAVIDSRIEDFRALSGLTQKYYLQDPATDEPGDSISGNLLRPLMPVARLTCVPVAPPPVRSRANRALKC